MSESANTTPAPGELWNDRSRGPRMPVRIQSVDATHATVTGELDGETMPGTRRIHLSHFANGSYILAV